jgi:hypothetical protein
MFPALFALVILGIGSHVFVLGNLDYDLPFYAFHVAGLAGVTHYTQLLFGGLTNFFLPFSTT